MKKLLRKYLAMLSTLAALVPLHARKAGTLTARLRIAVKRGGAAARIKELISSRAFVTAAVGVRKHAAAMHMLTYHALLRFGEAAGSVRAGIGALAGKTRLTLGRGRERLRQAVKAVFTAKMGNSPAKAKAHKPTVFTEKSRMFVGLARYAQRVRVSITSRMRGNAASQKQGRQRTEIDVAARAAGSGSAQERAEQAAEVNITSRAAGSTSAQEKAEHSTETDISAIVTADATARKRARQDTEIGAAALARANTSPQEKATHITRIGMTPQVKSEASSQKTLRQGAETSAAALIRGESAAQKRGVQRTEAYGTALVRSDVSSQKAAKQRTETHAAAHVMGTADPGCPAGTNEKAALSERVRAALDSAWQGSALVKALTAAASRMRLAAAAIKNAGRSIDGIKAAAFLRSDGQKHRAAGQIQGETAAELRTDAAEKGGALGAGEMTARGQMAADALRAHAAGTAETASGLVLINAPPVHAAAKARVHDVFAKAFIALTALAGKAAAKLGGLLSKSRISAGGHPIAIKSTAEKFGGRGWVYVFAGGLQKTYFGLEAVFRASMHSEKCPSAAGAQQTLGTAAAAKAVDAAELGTGAKAALSERAVLSIYHPSDWEYPVQDGEKLTITQVYSAVQEGEKLTIY